MTLEGTTEKVKKKGWWWMGFTDCWSGGSFGESGGDRGGRWQGFSSESPSPDTISPTNPLPPDTVSLVNLCRTNEDEALRN